MSNSPFLNSVRKFCRVKHYSLKTEKAYLHWIKRFIFFHKKQHPLKMAEPEVEQLLTYIAQVLNHEEAMNVISHLKGVHQLIGALMYGGGFRISEVLRLRIKDFDFTRHTIAALSGELQLAKISEARTKSQL
jgi:integrase